MRTDPVHLVIGCGYLGKRLTGLLNGKTVWTTNRSGSQYGNSILLDINDKETWPNMDVISNQSGLIVYLMVPPSQIDLKRFSDFTNKLINIKSFRNILISSTVVYGNKDRIVNSDSDVDIDNARAERQYNIEQIWLNSFSKTTIVRLAGIYGPERVIGLNSLLQGEVINGDPEGWLNLIQVDDAAALIKKIGEMEQSARIELGSDGNPVKREEYYSFLANLLHKPLSGFRMNEQSRGVGRRCDNKLTMQRTGWRPGYVDYKKALAELINK